METMPKIIAVTPALFLYGLSFVSIMAPAIRPTRGTNNDSTYKAVLFSFCGVFVVYEYLLEPEPLAINSPHSGQFLVSLEIVA